MIIAKIVKFLPLPVIACHLGYSADDGVFLLTVPPCSAICKSEGETRAPPPVPWSRRL